MRASLASYIAVLMNRPPCKTNLQKLYFSPQLINSYMYSILIYYAVLL